MAPDVLCSARGLNRYCRFDLPTFITQIREFVGGLLCGHIDESKLLSLVAIDPGQSDHGGGSRVTTS